MPAPHGMLVQGHGAAVEQWFSLVMRSGSNSSNKQDAASMLGPHQISYLEAVDYVAVCRHAVS